MSEISFGRGEAGLGALEGTVGRGCLATSPDGRHAVVRERLYSLLTTLGELPGEGSGPSSAASFSAELDALCPSGHVVLHSCRAPEDGFAINDLVVGRAGVVVVGCAQGPVPGRPAFSQKGAGWPGPVRETLRRAFALRAWFKEGGRPHAPVLADVPVLAAVCVPSVADRVATSSPSRPALMLDGLWVGPMDQLPAWLLSVERLEGSAWAEVASFLKDGLQAG